MDGKVPSRIPPPDESAQKWYFTEETLSKMPSLTKGGFDRAKELKYRQQAAGFIQEMGEKLNHNVKDPKQRM